MSTPTPNAPPPDDRRGFLGKFLALAIGAIALAVPAVAALAAFLNPWRQKSAGGQWIHVASLDALPLGGPPQRYPVIADRSDAWNSYPSEAIGAVFLCRTGEKEVIALQSICPHNGGCVSFDGSKKCFICPAHGAAFDVAGRRIRLDNKGNASPRDMDTLEVDPKRLPEIWVNFEKFQDGTAQKLAKA